MPPMKEKHKSKRHLSRPGVEKSKNKSRNVGKQQHKRPTIPFAPTDRILLLGEGDFSFARALVENILLPETCEEEEEEEEEEWEGFESDEQERTQEPNDDTEPCHNGRRIQPLRVMATCHDSEAALYEKYPQARPHVDYLRAHGAKVFYGIDATRLETYKNVRKGFGSKDEEKQRRARKRRRETEETEEKGEENIDGLYDVICMNFPHVGGLSTDVNRQVRANQALVVSTLKSSLPLLSLAASPGETLTRSTFSRVERPSGVFVLTTFTAPPYTLWNVKDLARHVGMTPLTSFLFPWTTWRGFGYEHVRTLGNLRGSSKDGEQKKGDGGWEGRGEVREARTWVFGRKGWGGGQERGGMKRRRSDEDESD